MQEKRSEWKTLIRTLDVKHLYFLDESGVNTDMTRAYGRAQGGERVVGSVPLNTPKSTTILSSICLSGNTNYGNVKKCAVKKHPKTDSLR